MAVSIEPPLPNSCSACGRWMEFTGDIDVRTGWRGWCCICNAEWHLEEAQVVKAKTECYLKEVCSTNVFVSSGIASVIACYIACPEYERDLVRMAKIRFIFYCRDAYTGEEDEDEQLRYWRYCCQACEEEEDDEELMYCQCNRLMAFWCGGRCYECSPTVRRCLQCLVEHLQECPGQQTVEGQGGEAEDEARGEEEAGRETEARGGKEAGAETEVKGDEDKARSNDDDH